MTFKELIVHLIESSQTLWNDSELEKLMEFIEDDIVITMEPVTVGGVHFKEQNIHGKEEALKFVKKYRHVLPLKYKAEYEHLHLKKHLVYKKYFYQLKIRATFDCIVSKYGRYQEFHIGNYENAKSKKITFFYILKNIIQYRLQNLLRK